ncbi:MAG TPA: TIGR03560 family F420-dependent LLM class oxidoreductase [Solirubrobacteraceae bacterium]|nr:TIGR03560 family F420-dependent LLM class oxidoreductase [Solirubrobacteraceae bacterium]
MELSLMIEGQEGVTWPDWLALAETCEAHGVPTLLRSDHYMNLDGRHPERGSLDAWVTISALAAVTSSLRLGTMVSPATFRHPSQLAKVVASADHVSSGRIDLGLGAGWHEREHAAFGFPFPGPRTRFDVLQEQLAIVRGAWAGGAFSFTGEHYTLSELDAQPKPVQPRVPIIIGGAARPRSVALAARYGDEYNNLYADPGQARERRERIAAACERAGRPPLRFSVMTVIIAGRDDGEVHDRAHALAEKMGHDAHQLLSDPPHGWILGTTESVIERLSALRDAGVDRIVCQQFVHDDLDHVALIGDVLSPAVA